MTKKWIKPIFFLVILLVFIAGFSSSYTSHNIDNLAYVTAIGIDSTESHNNLKVTFQFAKLSSFSQNGSSEGTNSVINTVQSSSIDSAINVMNSYVGKELNLAHCKVIVFSEEICRNGISDEIYTLINNNQIRPSTNIIVTKCDANYYIQNSKPSLEKSVTKYYDIFPNSSKYTGYTANITLGQFFNRLVYNTRQNVAILGGINTEEYQAANDNNSDENSNIMANESSIIGKRRTENIGLAVFKEDILVGELTALETISFLLLRNDIDTFLISLPSSENNTEYIDLNVNRYKSVKSKVQIVNGSPYIKVNVPLTARIASVSEDSKYLDNTRLESISKYAESYLESNISNYLYRTSKEFHSDINGFGRLALKLFPTTKQWEDYNWLTHYKDSFFDVNVDVDVKSTFLLTET